MTVVVSKIMWAVSPDHCSPYRQLTGTRPPEPPPEPFPPDDPTVDHYYYQVVLLIGSESNVNVDESPYYHGNAGGVPTTTNAKFGTHSMNINDLSGIMSYGGNQEWNLSPTQMSEFTIEAWIYLTEANPNFPQTICGRSFLSVQWVLMVDSTELRFTYQNLESGFGGNGAFTNVITTGANIFTNRWYYVAVSKSADKNIRLYVDGVMKGKRKPNDASIDGTSVIDQLNIGQIGFFGTNRWVGQIDELRITKGSARYRSNTTIPVPTRAWPRPPPGFVLP